MKQSFLKTCRSMMCLEVVAATHHLRYEESQRTGLTVPSLLHLGAGARASSRRRGAGDCGLKCLAKELVRQE